MFTDGLRATSCLITCCLLFSSCKGTPSQDRVPEGSPRGLGEIRLAQQACQSFFLTESVAVTSRDCIGKDFGEKVSFTILESQQKIDARESVSISTSSGEEMAIHFFDGELFIPDLRSWENQNFKSQSIDYDDTTPWDGESLEVISTVGPSLERLLENVQL